MAPKSTRNQPRNSEQDVQTSSSGTQVIESIANVCPEAPKHQADVKELTNPLAPASNFKPKLGNEEA
jgi:hypothetical protein